MAAFAATFVVNSNGDLDDGTCDVTHCSFREAIIAANGAPDADRIEFGALLPGEQTITSLRRYPRSPSR